MPEATNAQTTQSSGFHRIDDFTDEYANNFQFEQSVFDLKIVFGQLNQATGSNAIDQHTAITIPWISAKLLMYYLQTNIAFYEFQNGKISLPPALMPQQFDEPTEEQRNITGMEEFVRRLRTIRDEFVASASKPTE